MLSETERDSLSDILFNIDVLCTVSSWERLTSAFARHQLKSKPHRFGKRQRRFDSPRRQFRAVLPGSVYFQ